MTTNPIGRAEIICNLCNAVWGTCEHSAGLTIVDGSAHESYAPPIQYLAAQVIEWPYQK